MTQTDPAAPVVSAAPAKRRRWPWILLALAAFFVVLLALAPTMFAGAAAGAVASGFNDEHEGRLEIGGLDLSWTGRQALRDARLLDPQGREVAYVSVDLPSLMDLATSGGSKLGKIAVRARADLVADDAGVTNLDRALAEKPGRAKKKTESDSDGSSTDLGKLLRELDLEVDVVVERVAWSDATTRATGKPFVIEDLKLAVLAKPGQPLTVTTDGKLAGEQAGAIRANVTLNELFKGSQLNREARFEVDAALDAIPSALIDAVARQDGVVTMALGKSFRVTAKGAGSFTQGALQLAVVGDNGRIEFSGDLADGVLGSKQAAQLNVDLAPQAEALARVLKSKLPPEIDVESVGAPHLKLSVGELRIEVNRVLDALNAGGDVVGAALGATRANVSVDAGAWRAAGPFAPDTAGVEVRGVTARVELTPTNGLAALQLSAVVAQLGLSGGKDSSAIEVRVDCADAAQALALADRGELSSTKLVLTVSKLPQELIAALAPGAAEMVSKLSGPLAVDATVEFPKAAPAKVAAIVSVSERATALRANLVASIVDPLGLQSKKPEGALPELTAQLDVTDLSILSIVLEGDSLASAREVLGDKLTAQFTTKPAGGSVGLDDIEFGANVKAARVDVSTTVRLKNNVLWIDDSTPLQVAVRPSAAMIDRYVGAKLPEGAKLAFASDAPELKVRAGNVQLPLDAWMGPEAAKTAADGTPVVVPLGDVIRRATTQLRVEMPALRYEQPPLAAGGKSTPISLDSLALDAAIRGGQPAEFNFRGRLAGEQATDLALRASCDDLGAFVDGLSTEAGPPASAAMKVSGDIPSFPTALADALAAQEGLLVDVLGAQMSLKVAGSWPSGAADPLRAEMTSPTASVRVEASLDGMVMRSQEGGGIDASVPLSPLFSERIVGKLVPLCVNAAKPPGASPVTLNVHDFQLPLDGDLRKLNGVVELDLGEITYDLLPGLTNTLAPLGLQSASQKTTNLKKLSLPIKDGVVGYDRLPISVGGRELAFKGSFDLATLELNFAGDVPLEVLGKQVSGELEKAREYLDPKMIVPIQLKGTWKSPKLRVGDDFLKTVVKKAAEKAAENALKGGLQDLLGGKKKKD